MCLGVFLFEPNLFGTLCASWTCMSISFTKLGKFSFIIFSYKFSISSSSFSPSGIITICWHSWRCPRGSSTYPCFVELLFLLFVLVGCLSFPYVPHHWLEFQLPSLLCWFPVDYSLFHLFSSFLHFFISSFIFFCHTQEILWASW